MKITVLGSGTSSGVPLITCECPVCQSKDPRDQRLRPAIAISFDGHTVLIDTPPDFRTQALRARLHRVDAVLFTHPHADHIMGMDDLRPFNFKHQTRIPIYGTAETIDSIRRVFHYIFEGRSQTTFIPQIDAHVLDETPLNLFGQEFVPIPVFHGKAKIYGYRFGKAAYLTDHSDIPPASMALLKGLDVLFLDALRHRPHPTHSTVATSIETVRLLQPKQAYFTHISHELEHAGTEAQLPDGIRMAYDGLEVDVA